MAVSVGKTIDYAQATKRISQQSVTIPDRTQFRSFRKGSLILTEKKQYKNIYNPVSRKRLLLMLGTTSTLVDSCRLLLAVLA